MELGNPEMKEMAGGGIEVNRLQIPPKRDVSGDNFVRGVQDFDFSIGGRYAFRPSKSYFRVALNLTQVANQYGQINPPSAQDNLAFADNPCAGLWDNVYVRAGNADVSSIVNYAAQAHQVKTRLGKSKAWLDSIGRQAFGYSADFQDRVNQVSTNGLSNEEFVLAPRYAISSDKTASLTVGGTGDPTPALVTGTGTKFQTGDQQFTPGDILVIDNERFTISTVTSDTAMTVSPAPPTTTLGVYEDTWVETATEPASERRSDIYFMYQPPVGIFDHDGLLGSGEYRISMNPNSRFKTAVIESLKAKLPGTDYEVTVKDVQFFPCIEKANIAATGVEKLFLTEQHIQSKKLQSGTGTSVLDFTVPPSTTSITVFVQDQKAGTDTTLPLTKFKVPNQGDEQLTHIQLTYANVSKPSTNWGSSFNSATSSQNYMTQRYVDSAIDSGMFYSEGGSESFTQWRKRGPIYHFDFSRDSEDRSTNLQLSMSFGAGGVGDSANVMIVSHFSRVASISSTNGRITNVQTLSI